MTSIPPTIDFQAWLAENEHLLKPPVNNRAIQLGDDFIVQIVGGPNQRTDFHIDPYEEWFYQVKGNMHVNVMTDDGPDTVHIHQGQMWMLPRELPHSPQRPEPGSIGIVIERIREDGVDESFVWYCPSCSNQIYEVRLHVTDIVKDLPPAFERFYNDEAGARTCSECGTVHPGRG